MGLVRRYEYRSYENRKSIFLLYKTFRPLKNQLDHSFNIIKVEFEEYFPTLYKYFKEYFLMNGNIWKTIYMWTERLGR